MKILNILEKIQRTLNIGNQKKIEMGLQEIENAYQNTETREEAIKEATRRATQEINSNPDLALKVLKLMEKSDELPKQVIVETIKNIPNTEQIKNPGQTVVKAVENSDLLNSRDIKEIIKEADITVPTAQKVADQIPDDVIREEEKERLEKVERERRIQAKKQQEQNNIQKLKDMYVHCKGIDDKSIFDELRKIRQENRNQKIKDMIIRVLAREAAIECKQVGIARLYEMYRIITPEEMLESGFPDLVEEEYEEIKDINAYKILGKEEHKLEKNTLLKSILEEVAKNVAKTYNDVGIIDIPQSETMKNITQDEEDEFIKQIQKNEEEEMEEGDIDKIKSQIRGVVDYEFRDLEEIMKKVPQEEIINYVRSFKQQIIRGKLRKRNVELSPELEEEIEELKEEIENLDEEEAYYIIEEAKDTAKEKKKKQISKEDKDEMKAENEKIEGTTQSDSDDEHMR